MKLEERIIHASILTGWTDIVIGLFMYFTGWADWYYNHFHFFGVLGIGMLTYGLWHNQLLKGDKNDESGRRTTRDTEGDSGLVKRRSSRASRDKD